MPNKQRDQRDQLDLGVELRQDALRVGIFSESFSPVRNGVSTSLNTLIGGMRQAGHRVWACVPAHEDQDLQETNVLRFPSFVTAYNRDYPLAYPFYPRLALSTHFNRLRLDIVHTHTPFVLGLTGAKLALTRGTPLVSTFHTLYSQYTHYVPFVPDAMSQSLLDVYLPWYYNRCSHIICPSTPARRFLEQVGVESPIEVIPTGVPIPDESQTGTRARSRTRKKLGWGPTTPILLYAGRLSGEKNVAWLFEVLKLVRATAPASLLAIAGDGPDREALEHSAEAHGLSGAVQFLGSVPRDRLNTIYAAADVFCFASESETQGLVVAEARAAGLPTVVVDRGGAPETVENGVDGYRIAPGNAGMFADSVLSIICSRANRKRMSDAARRRAVQFTPSRMIERVIGVYDTARANPQRARSLVPHIDGKASYWSIFLQP